MPPVEPGQPRQSPKPQPLGNALLLFLCTLSTLCAVIFLWRRASAIRSVVGHQLKSWTGQEGAVRLSLDDGPAATEFLEDDYDQDNEDLADDEPLALRAQQLKSVESQGRAMANFEPEPNPFEDESPTPPPKV